MISERGTRFDPIVLDAFFERIDEIEKIRKAYDDQHKVKIIEDQKNVSVKPEPKV